ncbi:MAG: elongation factor G [Spirochaetaceae bacterium]|jgi:elongation factor G|nr:elongation factor G [Spirochaetaceae bacterium]
MGEYLAVRNLALVGHGGGGKTTLLESLLYSCGALNKREAVGSGKSVGACGEDEVERGLSIRTAGACAGFDGVKINFFDAPGASDFAGEVLFALNACDMAALVIDCKAGVQIEALKLWRLLREQKKPVCVVVNKIDEDGASFEGALADIKEKLKMEPVPVSIPVPGGVIDCLNEKIYFSPADGGREKEAPIPAEFKEAAVNARIRLIEAAADGDEILTEKYILLGSLEPEETQKGLQEMVCALKLLPVFAASAAKNSGVLALLNFLKTSSPPPKVLEAADGVSLAFVLKTVYDQFNGKVSYIKALSGAFKSDAEIFNISEGKKERALKLNSFLGGKFTVVKELCAGDVAVVCKSSGLKTNDVLSSAPLSKDEAVLPPLFPLPHPCYSLAVFMSKKEDEEKLGAFLTRCAEEDKTFSFAFNPETKETVVSGMGELHLAVILEAAAKSLKKEIETRTPAVAYRETITKKASAEYTHKKQTGGHGQFARVVLEIEPLERGGGCSFSNAVVGGAVSKGYVPAVEKGAAWAMERGVVCGYPVVDVRVKLLDGKEHPVDSSELAFKTASRNAFREAMKKAGAVLLEPIMKLTVFADEKYTGAVMSAISSKRGKVLGQEAIGGGIEEIRALCPASQLLRYAVELRALTSGTASFDLEASRYEVISGKIAEDVIKASAAFNTEKEGGD